MFTENSRSPIPVIAAIGFTLLFLIFFIYVEGIQLWVLHVYRRGGDLFVNGKDPYAGTLIAFGPSGQFKYSPLFALLGRSLSAMGSTLSIYIWLMASAAAFVFALRRWIDQSALTKPWFLVVLLATMTDLYVSLSVNQANALIVAMMLWGLADYRDRKYFSAGVLLMLATNLKVYPVIFLFALALECNRPFLRGAFVAGVAAFVVPALFVGWDHNLLMHMTWVHVVSNDTTGVGILDLRSTLSRIGMMHLGQSLELWILVLSLPLFFAYRIVARNSDMRPWIAFGCAALLLLSPRTEIYTFVLLAPSYVMVYLWFTDSNNKRLRSYGGLLPVLFGVLIASCRFTIHDWFASEHPMQFLRVLGALGFWVLSGAIMVRTMVRPFQMPR